MPISSNRRRRLLRTPSALQNLVQSELLGRLKARGLELEVPVSMLGRGRRRSVESGEISGKMLKDLYDLSFERNKDFPAVYDEEDGRSSRATRRAGETGG